VLLVCGKAGLDFFSRLASLVLRDCFNVVGRRSGCALRTPLDLHLLPFPLGLLSLPLQK
jgi:hypothetical protein